MVKKFILAWVLVCAVLAAQTETAESPFAAIQEHIAELSRITGLKALKKVQYATMNRDELKRFLEQRVKEEIKPEEIRVEELALKKLGLVPQDFQLARTMIELMTEQAEAFYDYRQKKMYLMESDLGPTPIQQAALVHELAHALADQHFHLEKFIKRGKTDDSSLARMAVMEGQATWIMYEWMASKAGQSLRRTPALANMMDSRSDQLAAQYPVLGGAPLYLRASLLFPYTAGLKFQQAVLREKGDAAFTEVFRNPPATSQHVMHPEKYFAGVAPVEPKLPAVPGADRYKEIADATVGEFDHQVLIEQYAGREAADKQAHHWRGGSLRLLEDKKDKKVAMVYASEWASPEAAREMFGLYRKVLSGKWKKVSFTQDGADTLAGSGDDGVFLVRLEGTRVSSVEGLPALSDTAASPQVRKLH